MADETPVGEPKQTDWPARLRSEVVTTMADADDQTASRRRQTPRTSRRRRPTGEPRSALRWTNWTRALASS